MDCLSELSPIATDAPAALEGIELARRVVDELSEKQAEGIVLLDISEVSSVADYFVIATTLSKRQFNAITDALRKVSEPRPRIEGTAESGWLLYDFGDVVVHVFGQVERDYYDLESLWSHGRQLLRLE
jgi:ribosome-associated protein